MPHITLPDLPGISGPLNAYPATARHLLGLAQELLRGESTLSPAERETIAAFVSHGNQCRFCTQSHAAAARELWDEKRDLVDQVLHDADSAPLDEKMHALLHLADKVRRDARSVNDNDIQRARQAGADDKAIHDTVLIAAAFCMFNRYVDGLATIAPEGADAYQEMGVALAQHGYGNAR